MIVNIDEYSGFCFGVKKTIQIAEGILEKEGHLYCLGEIVHNEEETKRLINLGLEIIDFDIFENLSNTKVLLRSHGEPPKTYQIAKDNNIEIIEGTCPIVLKLQSKVKTSFAKINDSESQIVIFGKEQHPEVISLKGQRPDSTIILNDITEINNKIDPHLPIKIFSQTTQNTESYHKFISAIESFLVKNDSKIKIEFTNSICKAVSNKNKSLTKFARNNNVIIFVGGKNSSNGKMLFEHCKSINVNSYYISNSSEINKSWFAGHSSVGVCGATSTPQWLMEDIAKEIETI